MPENKYKRILLKLSGEALSGEQKSGIDTDTVDKICEQIKELVKMKTEVAIVVGGGNFWRGANKKMERTTSDYMRMLATTMNGLALQNALEEKGYNPINQIVGYLLSGDPAYIPRLNDARNLIRKYERDEIIEELVRSYLDKGEK